MGTADVDVDVDGGGGGVACECEWEGAFRGGVWGVVEERGLPLPLPLLPPAPLPLPLLSVRPAKGPNDLDCFGGME